MGIDRKAMTTTDFLYALQQIPPVALEELLNTILIGDKKHGPDTMDKSDKDTELTHIYNHWERLCEGHTHDEDDGQHHAAAMAVRCLKIIALDGRDILCCSCCGSDDLYYDRSFETDDDGSEHQIIICNKCKSKVRG